MENLVRVKIDSHRGGQDSIAFLRPCFRIFGWNSDELEIWRSDDDGISWNKLDSSQYTASFRTDAHQLYVTIIDEIEDISLLAFFDIDGEVVNIGWKIDGASVNTLPSGWSAGETAGGIPPIGYSIRGALGLNVPVSYGVRCPSVLNIPSGFNTAVPVDFAINFGCSIGEVGKKSVKTGCAILGMREFPVDLKVLDDATILTLSAEAAHRKQKTVQLNGMEPEVLD
ncbi:MAG TPA: hypothetical protein ENN67_02565 [Firmicutes bacterium]|nr:hypothetical protein [Bacillota bacterium]